MIWSLMYWAFVKSERRCHRGGRRDEHTKDNNG
jgi:hypothetical protein